MKPKNGLAKTMARYVLFILPLTISFACENHNFDSDSRQIVAKNEIKRKLRRITNFDVTSFAQDTVKNIADSSFKTQIRYTMGISYNDSNKVFQQKKGVVMFTPDGTSVISTEISDQ
jgi:hypothetical protein